MTAQFSVAEVHEAIAETRPDEVCLVFRDKRLTWAQVTERTRRLGRPAHVAIAIANPITGDRVSMTNHHWSFSRAAVQAEFGLGTLRVLNDFVKLETENVPHEIQALCKEAAGILRYVEQDVPQ